MELFAAPTSFKTPHAKIQKFEFRALCEFFKISIAFLARTFPRAPLRSPLDPQVLQPNERLGVILVGVVFVDCDGDARFRRECEEIDEREAADEPCVRADVGEAS